MIAAIKRPASAESTMREVVKRLRVENCRASLELQHLQRALDEAEKRIELLVLGSRELLVMPWDTAALLRDAAARLSTQARQLVGAVRAVRVEVLGWNVVGTTAKPSPHKPAMRNVAECLRAEQIEAFGELEEFAYASEFLSQNVETLAKCFAELHAAVQIIDTRDTVEGYQRVRDTRAWAEKVFVSLTQLFSAFQILRLGVRGWDIMGTDADTK